MTISVYIDKNTGDDSGVEWTAICREPDFIWVTREAIKHVGRYGSKPRKRQFAVYHYTRSKSGTLNGVLVTRRSKLFDATVQARWHAVK